MANDPTLDSPAYRLIPVTWDSSATSESVNLAHFKHFLFHCKPDPSGLAGTAFTFESAFQDAGPFQAVTNGAGAALTLALVEGEDVPITDATLARALAGMNLIKIVSDQTEDGIPLRIGANR